MREREGRERERENGQRIRGRGQWKSFSTEGKLNHCLYERSLENKTFALKKCQRVVRWLNRECHDNLR